nr:hypothetical protein [Tanacetum cinerariifolium]
MSSKDAEEESTESDSDDNNTRHLTDSMVESSKKKKLKKFDFVTKGEEQFHLTEEQIRLRINLDRPLSEHDSLDKLNDLAMNKRKHADDIHDFFRANKRLKSSV